MTWKCRGCGQSVSDHLLITYHNMPKSAQFLPHKEDLAQEKGVDIRLRQCSYCGLIQAGGQPVPYYKDVIRATGLSAEMYIFRQAQFQSWVDKFDLKGRKIIEIGCGHGEYMQVMEETGVDVYGLEHQQASVKAGEKEGHRIFEGFLDTQNNVIPQMPYDGFYCLNFLEHIPEPGNFLRNIAYNLKAGAIGLVEVPNLDMILEKALYSEFIQDHLSYFTAGTLKNILEQNGFEVIDCKEVFHSYIISAQVRKRTLLDTSSFELQRIKLEHQVTEYLEVKKELGKKAAVWGAGHQALANLSLLHMKDYIDYVIDSAEFKQNCYTPATHIPIVSPDILLHGEIKCVIIMAAGYSDEIKKIMESHYPDIEIAILTEDGLEVFER